MLVREQLEKKEYEILSPYASHAGESRGRLREEKQDDLRTCFMRDRDRIVHSKAFRRLKDKTQVFLEPEDPHFRTRLTHTMEVSQIARTIAKALFLNEDLTEAIALGHDLGHTPYGHSGEFVLNELLSEAGLGGFRHNEQSLRIVDVLEKDGKGLNLSFEVRDGILNHGLSTSPSTLEGKVVRISDKLAYLHHDMDDAIRARILTEDVLPEKYTKILGHSVKERLNALVMDIVNRSRGQADIIQSEPMYEAMIGLREFMTEQVYTSSVVKHEERKSQDMLRSLYRYYFEHPELIPDGYRRDLRFGEPLERAVSDYISGMTDQYAVQMYMDYFVPVGWHG